MIKPLFASNGILAVDPSGWNWIAVLCGGLAICSFRLDELLSKSCTVYHKMATAAELEVMRIKKD